MMLNLLGLSVCQAFITHLSAVHVPASWRLSSTREYFSGTTSKELTERHIVLAQSLN